MPFLAPFGFLNLQFSCCLKLLGLKGMSPGQKLSHLWCQHLLLSLLGKQREMFLNLARNMCCYAADPFHIYWHCTPPKFDLHTQITHMTVSAIVCKRYKITLNESKFLVFPITPEIFQLSHHSLCTYFSPSSKTFHGLIPTRMLKIV